MIATDPADRKPDAANLDPAEHHVRIASPIPGRTLFLRYLPPARPSAGPDRVVLYVHGGTFGSALSVAHRFGGLSWRDALCAAGFHVWGLDFHGFDRFSDPLPGMDQPAEGQAPLGRTADASLQLEHAMRFIGDRHRVPRVSLIAHSWGSLVAGHFAGRRPDLVDRMVFFGPIARRPPKTDPVRLPGWRLITLKDQWDRFTETVPAGSTPVLSRRHFEAWGERYLDCDSLSRSRSPASVKVPSGPFQDIFDCWAGAFPYDPELVRAPVAIVRGEWDNLCTDADAAWLFDALAGSPERRDIKIGRATHLMHLEANRHALYRETETFLRGDETNACRG